MTEGLSPPEMITSRHCRHVFVKTRVMKGDWVCVRCGSRTYRPQHYLEGRG